MPCVRAVTLWLPCRVFAIVYFVVLMVAPSAAASTATTAALSITSGGSPVTTVNSQTTVTLTATVMAGSNPATPGQVNFCDATAAYCGATHLLGVAQVTSAGTAVLSFRPGPGGHSYKAVFLGTTTYASSASASTLLTVSASTITPTLTSLSASGASGNYILTSTVTNATAAFPAPAGTVSFVNSSDNDSVLATQDLAAASDSHFLNTLAAAPYDPQRGGKEFLLYQGSAIVDLNGDGIADIASADYEGFLNIFLGMGGGKFAADSVIDTSDYSLTGIAIADFNQDGIPDVSVCSGIGAVAILLGNGDGTYKAPIRYKTSAAGGSFYRMITADFNRDGIPDLAIATDGSVSVLLGNGDGTFTAKDQTVNITPYPMALVAADFNGDGIPDLALGSDILSIYLGNGDGTFTAATPAISAPPGYNGYFALMLADFNGDGIPDLAAGNGAGNNKSTVLVLLGNGDGTFLASASIPIKTHGGGPGNPGEFGGAVGDFNGDGIPDIISQGTVAYGNGDGSTFTVVPLLDTTSLPIGSEATIIDTVVGDLNGDGISDFVNASGGLSGYLSDFNSATAAAQITLTAGTSQNLVEATYSGDSSHSSSLSVVSALAAAPIPTSLTITTNPVSDPENGQPVTLTATLSPYIFNSHSSDGETILFRVNAGGRSTALGSGTLTGGVATLALSAFPANQGISTLVASYQGDDYLSGTTAQIGYQAVNVDPTITLSVSPSITTAGQPVTLTSTLTGTDPYAQVAHFITFYGNSTRTLSLGTAPVINGVATLTTSSSSPRLYSLSAYTPAVTGTNAAYSPSVPLGVQSSAALNVTLQMTSGGSAVSSTAQATPVTFTAVVTSSGLPVTAGTVLFCDAQAAGFCTPGGYQTLGAASLSKSATASVVLRPSIGTHSIVAMYLQASGTGLGLSSASSLTVTGKFATITGTPPNTNAPSSIFGVAPPSAPAPTGTVQWIDLSLSNAVLGTYPITPLTTDGVPDYYYQLVTQTEAPSTSINPFSIISADFNDDGIPDLAVANAGDNTAGVFLGVGDGSFQTQVTYPVGSGAYAIAAGDFNGDGFTDLAVTNLSANTVSILLGRGDGSFQAQRTFSTGNGPDAIAVGDFDGDGNLDLMIANKTDNTVAILPGTGDGSFGVSQSLSTGTEPVSMVVADFNGDGDLDVATVNNGSDDVSVLLGKGDGTFQSQVTYALGSQPITMASGYTTSSGHLDLVVGSSEDANVAVLAGNGDGTFSPAKETALAFGGNPRAVITGNFSQRTQSDILVACSDTELCWLAGGVARAVSVGSGAISLVAADLNGDGLLDAAVLNNTTHSISVVLNESGPQATYAHLPFSLPRKHTLEVVYSGDSYFASSTSPSEVFSFGLTSTKITAEVNSSLSSYGMPVAITANLTPASVGDVSTDGGTVTFTAGSTTLGTAMLASGKVTLTTTLIPVGVQTITVTYTGSVYFATSTTTLSVTVTPSVLTITSPTLSRAYNTDNPSLNGTSAGAVNGDTFAVTGSTTATQTSPPGTYPIVPAVTGTGLANYSVVKVNGTLTITQGPPTLTVTAPTMSRVYGAANPSLNGAYTGAINGDTFTVTGSTTATQSSTVGSYAIVPSVTGTNLANYTVVSVNGALMVTQAPLTIAAPMLTRAYGTANPSLNGAVTGAVNGDTFTVSGATAATQTSAPGGYIITPTAIGANLTDYRVTAVDGNLTITTAIPGIALTSSAASVSGTDTVTLTANVTSSAGTPTGSVSFYNGGVLLGKGDLTAEMASFVPESLDFGSNSLTATYSGDTNFTPVSSSPVVVTETFAFDPPSGSSSTATISSGGTANYTLAVTPPGLDTFSSAITFSVSGLPAGATAVFSPTTVPAGSGATNVKLAVSLSNTTAMLEKRAQSLAGAAAALCLIMFPLPLFGRGRRKLKLLMLLAVGLITLGVLTACGGSSGGGSKQPTPQTYNLTVTATSSSLTNTAKLTLTVE